MLETLKTSCSVAFPILQNDKMLATTLRVTDCHLNLHTRLDGDGGDLLDHIWCADEINHPFVNPHLKTIPGVGAFATGRLPGGDVEHLGGHPDGALQPQQLTLGTLHQIAADFLEVLDVPGGESDADPVLRLHRPLEPRLAGLHRRRVRHVHRRHG